MKNIKMWALLGVLILVFALAGCVKTREVRVTEEQMGGTVELKQGETLSIELPANPSTGYAWEVKDLDTALLEPAGETEFIQQKSDEGLVGAPETQIIRLKAVAGGKTTLKLIYHRSFEQGVEPLDTKWLDVEIK